MANKSHKTANMYNLKVPPFKIKAMKFLGKRRVELESEGTVVKTVCYLKYSGNLTFAEAKYIYGKYKNKMREIKEKIKKDILESV
jgi:hypothetical protein